MNYWLLAGGYLLVALFFGVLIARSHFKKTPFIRTDFIGFFGMLTFSLVFFVLVLY